jgi:hypothetical protein
MPFQRQPFPKPEPAPPTMDFDISKFWSDNAQQDIMRQAQEFFEEDHKAWEQEKLAWDAEQDKLQREAERERVSTSFIT